MSASTPLKDSPRLGVLSSEQLAQLAYLVRTTTLLLRRLAKIGKSTHQLSWMEDAAWELVDWLDRLSFEKPQKLPHRGRRSSLHLASTETFQSRASAQEEVDDAHLPNLDYKELAGELRRLVLGARMGEVNGSDMRRQAHALEEVATQFERLLR